MRDDLTLGVGSVNICEGSLGRGNPGNDLGDGGSNEEVLSSPVYW